MGNFYVNHTIKGASRELVADAMSGRSAYVSPASKGCVVVFDEQSDSQDSDVIHELGAMLSRKLKSVVLAVLNHDDDVLWYELYDAGKMIDEYSSSPDYFEGGEDMAGPTGGNAAVLCKALGSANADAVEKVLRADTYAFALERHADLCQALGISELAVCGGYTYISEGELPGDLSEEDLVRTE